jgi:polyhydroxyalkanoate synthesis regulator phasin
MADIQERFKEAWSHALAGINSAEQEAEKIFNRLADAAGFSPEDVRRHAREFGDRLQVQRKELEKAIDDGVKKAASRLRVPTTDDIASIEKRLDAISARIDALAANQAPDKERQAE